MAMYVRLYSVRPDLGRERTENLRRGRARLGALGIPESVKAKARAVLKNIVAGLKIFGVRVLCLSEGVGRAAGRDGRRDRARFPSLPLRQLQRRLIPVQVSPICYGTARPAQARGRQ
jgi:hypothetical protein